MPDPSMIAIMKNVASHAGVYLDNSFSQIVDLNLQGGGLCTGLAAVWLDQLEKGEGGAFLEEVKTAAKSPDSLRGKVEDWHAKQKAGTAENPGAIRPWFQKDGLVETSKANSYEMYVRMQYQDKEELDAHYGRQADPITGQKPEINDPTGKFPIASDTFGNMVTWLNKTTLKRRFFLINTQQSGTAAGHTMAAGKNRMGLIRFFDPNGGIVSAWTASKMETFMREYFSTRKVFWAYRMRGTLKLQLDLEKYTPAKWGPSSR
jgi:hypothetical protein